MVSSKDRRHPPLLRGHTLSEVRRNGVAQTRPKAQIARQWVGGVAASSTCFDRNRCWILSSRLPFPGFFAGNASIRKKLEKSSPAAARLPHNCPLERPAVRRI